MIEARVAAALALASLFVVRTGLAAGWRLAFEDTFDGDALKSQNWATRYIYEYGALDRLNDEWQHYRDNGNHRVENGALSLVGRVVGPDNHYESGMIRSRRTFYFGYFEARVFLPNARGVWPAFWLNSDYDGEGRLRWPPEIDAFEYVINGEHETPDMIHTNVAAGNNRAQGNQLLYSDPAFNTRWAFFKNAAPLNQGWQIIGLLWKPDSVTMYLNGHKVCERAYKWVYDDGTRAGPAHILLNLAIGGRWAGATGVDQARFPQEFKIDYVRVCQYDATIGGPDRCANSPFAPSLADGAYATDVDDLPRSTLVFGALSSTTVKPGESITVRYIVNAVPTAKDHQIYTIVINDSGAEIARAAGNPPTPTSRWVGANELNQTVRLPPEAPAGRYSVLFAVGSRNADDSGYQNVPLNADPRFGPSDGHLRYTVGQLVAGVGPSGSPPR